MSSQPDHDAKKKPDADKTASTLQLLFRASKLLHQRALARAESSATRPALRASQSALLPLIDVEGTRLTVLAARLGVSKQAVSQLVDEMEQLGVLERAPDPNDARAKLVRFTAKGRRGMLEGMKGLRELEDELAEKIGKNKMKDLRRTVLALLEEVDEHWDAQLKS